MIAIEGDVETVMELRDNTETYRNGERIFDQVARAAGVEARVQRERAQRISTGTLPRAISFYTHAEDNRLSGRPAPIESDRERRDHLKSLESDANAFEEGSRIAQQLARILVRLGNEQRDRAQQLREKIIPEVRVCYGVPQ